MLIDDPQRRPTVRLSKHAVLEPAGWLNFAIIKDLLDNVFIEEILFLEVTSGALIVNNLWLLPRVVVLRFLVRVKGLDLEHS